MKKSQVDVKFARFRLMELENYKLMEMDAMAALNLQKEIDFYKYCLGEFFSD